VTSSGARDVSFAVGLPNVGQFGDPGRLVALAVDAEAAGWDAVFLWDHVLYKESSWPVADPTTTIAAIALATSRVRLGVMVTALPRRRPWKVAREIGSLQQLSSGRTIFGAGLGSMPLEFSAFGEPSSHGERAKRLDEGLEVLTQLWSGKPVTHHGAYLSVDDVQMLPKVEVPIWIAGRWPNRPPFRRAASFDGVMPTHVDYGKGQTMPPETLREVLAEVSAHRQPGLPRIDVALEGATDPADSGHVQRYVEAGLTWWVEALGWWRGDVDNATQRVRAGPPPP
jgi:alkanesulfonate monooxygenase SsuD/methylene tetrahydromethanopterin reductase-like flavin-dependent oxidoreductase (luciferase family)